ncbi:hypothetical protein HBH68_206630 [Parastagonospora nodorum]|nr:hypothetical protein HBH71_218080 [Parastagonospora nodorum]KAH5172178.1 hypothetical protein HBH68_206630 [Parastagonospora nodorum]
MNKNSWWLLYRDFNLRCTSNCLSNRLAHSTPVLEHYASTMALSMLIAIIAAPGLLGSQEAIRQSQSQEKREEHRARRCNLIATCVKSSIRSREINGRPVILRNGKLWIDTGTEDGMPSGHPYAGYYLPYPDSKHEGLVTTITDVAPVMNWIYVDKETHEVKYGVRLDAQPNLTGPFDCTRQDRRLTFGGWEGFCAIEEGPGIWALYFDVSDDGLQSKIPSGTRVLEIELSRKEKRFQKEPTARQHDQTTKRAVDAQEEAPVDQPLAPEALVSKPGMVDESPQAQAEALKPEPFRLPKSIFENPPPVLESSVFGRPLSPPPAYTSTDVGRPPSSDTITVDTGTAAPADNASAGTKSAQTPSLMRARQIVDTAQSIIDTTGNAQVQSVRVPPRAEPSHPSKLSQSRSPSPLDTASDSVSQKRTTPLKRSSGTRALAQAQMFEAMAAAQKPKIDLQSDSTRRTSRASSSTDSASQYSGDGQDVSDGIGSVAGIPKSVSPTPAPLAPARMKTKGPQSDAEARTIPEPAPSDAAAQRPRTPTRQRALTDSRDPAVFGANNKLNRGPLRQNTISVIPSARPTRSRSSSQTSSQSPRPQPLRRDAIARQSGSPRAPLQRRDAAGSPRVPPQARGPVTRTSLASTMTSGRGNRGMTARVGGSAERGRAAILQSGSKGVTARKTTSALFREIDELVSQDTKGQMSNDG